MRDPRDITDVHLHSDSEEFRALVTTGLLLAQDSSEPVSPAVLAQAIQGACGLSDPPLAVAHRVWNLMCSPPLRIVQGMR